MALMAYISIFGVGFILIILSALGGGDHEVHVEASHDISHGDSHGGTGHNWLSIRVISAFATAFGAGGSISLLCGLSNGWAIFIAICAGCLLGFLVDLAMVYLWKSQGSTHYSLEQMIGKEAVVNLTIRPGRIGQIAIEVNGERHIHQAVSHQDTEIKENVRVKVVSAGNPAVVERII